MEDESQLRNGGATIKREVSLRWLKCCSSADVTFISKLLGLIGRRWGNLQTWVKTPKATKVQLIWLHVSIGKCVWAGSRSTIYFFYLPVFINSKVEMLDADYLPGQTQVLVPGSQLHNVNCSNWGQLWYKAAIQSCTEQINTCGSSKTGGTMKSRFWLCQSYSKFDKFLVV